MNPSPIFSRPIEISTIGAARAYRRITATGEERVALAAELGLSEITALSGEIELKRDSKGTIHLHGQLSAEIFQECVVSLEPVKQLIDEPITMRFVQGDPETAPASTDIGGEINIEPMQDDPPEIVGGSVIDLGEIVIEHMLLAADPYPRAQGASLPDNPAEEVAETRESPFSVLAQLNQSNSTKR